VRNSVKPLRNPGITENVRSVGSRRPWAQGGREEERVVLRVEG